MTYKLFPLRNNSIFVLELHLEYLHYLFDFAHFLSAALRCSLVKYPAFLAQL